MSLLMKTFKIKELIIWIQNAFILCSSFYKQQQSPTEKEQSKSYTYVYTILKKGKYKIGISLV